MYQKKLFYLPILLLLLFINLLTGCKEIDSITIKDVNLEKVKDGTYNGEYKFFPVKVVVSIEVKNHQITEIKITKHRTGEGEKAEVIIEDVIRAQSLVVDAISGATLSSKCILKAIENALEQDLE
ncbi:FMN-binding protein [bacterium]|nr:FMN-binding protein [bacterium]